MMPCIVRWTVSLISFLNGSANFAIASQTVWFILWLANTSHKPISLTSRLVVIPNLQLAILNQHQGDSEQRSLPPSVCD